MSPRQPVRTGAAGLSARQVEILELLCEPGANRKTVARRLGISVKTVNSHLEVVYRRLSVSSDLQAWVLVRGRMD